MDLLRCKLTMQKLKELNLQDLHFQIMMYVEYEKIKKQYIYVMNQLKYVTDSIKRSLEYYVIEISFDENGNQLDGSDQVICTYDPFDSMAGTNLRKYIGFRVSFTH